MKLLLKGGTVVSGGGARVCDVLVEDGKIAAVGGDIWQKAAGVAGEDKREETKGSGGGEREETKGSGEGGHEMEAGPRQASGEITVRDVSGKLLFPGFIDAHTHFDLAVAGTVTADDFESGTCAALAGGTTTVVDFATQYRGESLMQALHNWMAKAAGRASCDYGFHMAITDWNEVTAAELPALMEAGVTSYKLYTTYDTKVDDAAIYQILRALKACGGIAAFHCENDGVIRAMQQEALAAGHTEVRYHAKTRPAPLEAEAIDRVLRIAGIVDVPVIIVHLTCEEGLAVITQARLRGQEVYAETCPQYLLLTDEVYEGPQDMAARFVCAPPLRSGRDVRALLGAIRDGRIDTVATDHCSFTLAQKRAHIGDFTKIPGGLPGVQNRAALLYTCMGGDTSGETVSAMCRLLSENPAKLYGLYPAKGVIAAGSDADITIFDPEAEGVIRARTLLHRTDYSPYEGIHTKGAVSGVLLGGEIVFEEGKVIKEGRGKYLCRKKYTK